MAFSAFLLVVTFLTVIWAVKPFSLLWWSTNSYALAFIQSVAINAFQAAIWINTALAMLVQFKYWLLPSNANELYWPSSHESNFWQFQFTNERPSLQALQYNDLMQEYSYLSRYFGSLYCRIKYSNSHLIAYVYFHRKCSLS